MVFTPVRGESCAVGSIIWIFDGAFGSGEAQRGPGCDPCGPTGRNGAEARGTRAVL